MHKNSFQHHQNHNKNIRKLEIMNEIKDKKISYPFI